MRVKKFGVQTENVKKNLRAARFGLPVKTGDSPVVETKKLDERAKRFGTAKSDAEATATSPESAKDKELLEKRAQRFGTAAATKEVSIFEYLY